MKRSTPPSSARERGVPFLRHSGVKPAQGQRNVVRTRALGSNFGGCRVGSNLAPATVGPLGPVPDADLHAPGRSHKRDPEMKRVAVLKMSLLQPMRCYVVAARHTRMLRWLQKEALQV